MMGVGVEGGGIGAGGANSCVVDSVVALGLVIDLYGVCVIQRFKTLDGADAVQSTSENVDFINVGRTSSDSDVSGGIEVEVVAIFVSEEICEGEVG